MYDFIEGVLESIYPTYIVINAQGIGYQLVCANPFKWQAELQKKVRCMVQQVVREDSITLYGFYSKEERELFMQLNKVSGIGPKSALSILALDDHDGLIQAIESGDSKYLMKFPGVGKKTSAQMILDLQGKLMTADDLSQLDSQGKNQDLQNFIHEETVEALLGLGYSVREINRVKKQLLKENFESTQEALSFAFKLLI